MKKEFLPNKSKTRTIAMLRIQIDSFAYFEKTVLQNISFEVTPGEHISVLGESGSGKTTLLHLIYGLFHLEHGMISYCEKPLTGPTNTLIPGEPFMKLVAQEFNIMPFSTVAENIGSYLSRNDRIKDEHRIDELLEIVDLKSYKNTLVKYLSGGQKQRVALAKALAEEPEILLLDEPFSNIDSFRKNDLRRTLFRYLKRKNISCISATHDASEALAFSDHILLMKSGTVERYETPEKLYKTAENQYQARFFGEANFIPKKYLFESKSSEEVLVYPDQLKIANRTTPLKVRVKAVYFQGSYYLIEAENLNTPLFFNHSYALELAKEYYLEVNISKNGKS